MSLKMFLGMVGLTAMGIAAVPAAHAEVPTRALCDATYLACDMKCQAADPKHGFSYAACSAKCVASKAACSSEIIYDKGATWTEKQYDAAKPWVKEKANAANEVVKDAIENSQPIYPKDDETSR